MSESVRDTFRDLSSLSVYQVMEQYYHARFETTYPGTTAISVLESTGPAIAPYIAEIERRISLSPESERDRVRVAVDQAFDDELGPSTLSDVREGIIRRLAKGNTP